ncbi:translation initiation factor IF-2 [Pseudobdellovibrio exovorus]|uniref:Translation initiation factor IF-2 n=1 Tax=Pseudobdellovibrio exovorus JSS TaxID=1184267 RepID=M4V964_9BACT|nr:translation initiation factor IF-2 [Pseudobdellovibrio exovorus]AGH95768.1 translation initiation factor IF-2 [Pseudobdellovibrio exovorus JSS]
MSNPKVFEFAKEVGMTPLALMDKIKEWSLPVKNHMAELEPEVLEQIKAKLAEPTGEATEEKPKRATRRSTTKKAANEIGGPTIVTATSRKAAAAKAAEDAEKTVAKPARTSVIRRKKDAEVAEETKAAESAAEEVAAPVETPVEAAPPVQAPVVEEVVAPVAAAPTPEAPVEAAPVAPVVVEKAAPTVSRKKEVSIGDSGVSSSANVALPKRNIVGRMDLSRVQGPPGSERGPRPQGGGFQRPQGGGAGGGFNTRSPGAGRNIRAGFVAQMPDPVAPTTDFDSQKRDYDKRSKKFGGTPTGGLSAKEKEQEEILQSFNAVEFRKREMVFQPKKKTAVLNRAAQKTQITTPKASKRILKVNGKMKVGDIAIEMGIKATQLIKALMTNGVMGNVNSDLDFDTIALIVPEFGWEAQNTFKTADEIVVETAFGNLEAELVIRPPVVTVMGHVDHGKTSLLDAIRNARVASGEAGGITQHIGAYSVTTEDGSLITFLDTPGHEAFTAMRARGANATDIAIIVVAADDGMMPQTAEAISHAKAAGVPIIVAVNKMDKPGANPDRIKQQLTELEIVPEEWGGSTIFCEVSALKRTGIPELLENIKLLAEVAELKANPEKSGSGLVIEAKLEKGKGPVATILVKDGHVNVGDYIVAGSMKGKVKSLTNDKGERVDTVTPGLPVEVLGLEGVPAAGDRFDVVVDERTAEEVVGVRKEQAMAENTQKKMSLEDMFSKVTQGDLKEFNIILKADVHGSLEAIQGMLNKMTSVEVKNKIVHAAVGGVTENDVMLAHTSKGVVIGFNVRPDNNAQAKAKQLGVDIRTYSIVYEMMDEIKKAMTGLLAPQVVEKVMGTAEVRNTFSVPKIGVIAGCFITSGKIQRSNMLRLVRDGKIVYEGKLGSLKRFKDDAKEVAEGFECGIGIENFNDVKVGDVIEAYTKEEVARELTPIN